MLGDNLLKLVEPDREDNRVRLRDRLAYGCGGSQRAELRGELLCMGLVLRGKHNTFAAADQIRDPLLRWPTTADRRLSTS